MSRIDTSGPDTLQSIETQPSEGREPLARRYYTAPGGDVFSTLEWDVRDARILDVNGDTVFEQCGVEVPAPWSQTATNVVASKYFRNGATGQESSARQLISRVADAIAAWGREDAYFASDEEMATFRSELVFLLLHQRLSFNSPVWFNVGIEPRPQCSACFILSVEDSLPSILDLAKVEGMLFKHGSGAGSNLSGLRSSQEELSGGGTASGPVSFMRGLDAFAGVIKSGGKTRRAAKMVILNADHPDILEFVSSKTDQEQRARALVRAGYDPGFDVAGGAYDSVFFQNANHSVRVTDAFMQSVDDDGEWTTRRVSDGKPAATLRARDLMREIAKATWQCGDPGLQFDSAINRWHTCPEDGPIRGSNPCSEFMFLDNSACNLASLNLMAFHDDDGLLDTAGLRHACEVSITAQEILVDRSGYPTPAIAEESSRFRPLGLGYANLGATLMARGLPYDSLEGRRYGAALTALMTGSAYVQSGRIARQRGAFAGFARNRKHTLDILERHHAHLEEIDCDEVPAELGNAARSSWQEALKLAQAGGVRNSQVTVLAPTGTIAFMMDCDTTGIEPEIALVRYKALVGGGRLRIVNRTVGRALERLGYSDEHRREIVAYVEKRDTVEGAPTLRPEHLPVFDCALRPVNGSRSIAYRGHLEMMAAVQPFLSGAISKTINLPAEASVEEIEAAYTEAWHLGLKAVAIYRDGCKGSQPVSTSREEQPATGETGRRDRRRLPDERRSITHKFTVGGHKGYITVGLYDDARPGEIFLVMAKEGSTISGLMDAFATSVSIALQYGVPLEKLIEKFCHARFEPSGFTGNPEIPMAKSIVDYVFRWLASKFLTPEEQLAAGVVPSADGAANDPPTTLQTSSAPARLQQDAPACSRCGAIMTRNGTCYRCSNCGSTSGCS